MNSSILSRETENVSDISYSYAVSIDHCYRSSKGTCMQTQ